MERDTEPEILPMWELNPKELLWKIKDLAGRTSLELEREEIPPGPCAAAAAQPANGPSSSGNSSAAAAAATDDEDPPFVDPEEVRAPAYDDWKMNGDIELAVTNVGSAIGGGLCIGFPEDEARLDCIEYGIILDTDTLADSNSMTVSFVDSYMAAGPSLKADERS